MLGKKISVLIFIITIAAILRFYNLTHDSPYFFDPDERNMANAVSQLRLPAKLSEIPTCLLSEFSILNPQPTTHNPQPNCNLNPHFFAYGQFPLYLAFASDQIINPMTNLVYSQPTTHNPQFITSFPSAIFWLRFYSALFSTLTVLFVYLITDKLFNFKFKNWYLFDNWKLEIGHYAAILAAFSPGLIQSAHFGTTESFLTFFFLASVYISLRYLSLSRAKSRDNLSHLRFIIFTSIAIGLAMGSKLTGIFFFVPPFLSLIIRIVELLKKRKNKLNIGLPARIATLCVAGGLVIIGSLTIFAISSPYNLADPGDFQSAVFGYESDVAMGKYEAFYTRQFVNTTPVIFQAEKIFPYTLGWPAFILGSIGILFITLKLILRLSLFILQKVQSSKFKVQKLRIKKYLDFDNWGLLGILILGFWIYFIPNAFLFAKWTRFMTPIFPFFSIFTAFALFEIFSVLQVFRSKYQISNIKYQINTNNSFVYWVIGLLVLIGSITPGLAFMSIYTHEDSRLTASRWIYQNIPNNAYILSETANVIDIPLSLATTNHQPITNNYTVISFDFYHIDENPSLGLNALLTNLERADYVFIPSRRIFANYTRLPQIYPLVTKYYQLLNSGALGFVKVAEISSFPRLELGILNLGFGDEQSEETFTVFDHPVIRIYRKTKPFTIDKYRSLFNI